MFLLKPTALGLVASILKPDLDLRLGELESVGQRGAVWTGHVALTAKTTLQLQHLSDHTRRYFESVTMILFRGARTWTVYS